MAYNRTRRFCTSKFHQGPRYLLWTEFAVKVWGDNTKTWPAQLQSKCRACERISSRTRAAVKRGHSPDAYGPRKPASSKEELLRRKRERHKQQMQDPKFRERKRMRQRVAYKRRRKQHTPMVDATEFLVWFDKIKHTLDPDMHDYDYIMHAVKSARSRKRMRHGTLDRILVSLDRLDLLVMFTQDTTPVP